MAIPAYLWLKGDGGEDIKGSVDIAGREGSIEIISLNHGVIQPTDKLNGKATSLREHEGPAGFASAGCIILSLSTRRQILREGGELEVVR